MGLRQRPGAQDRLIYTEETRHGIEALGAELARAKAANGIVQPDTYDQNYSSYVINHRLPIEVFVDDPTKTSV
jgi:hypothetical protein